MAVWRQVVRFLWDLLPFILLLFVVLVVLMADPDAVVETIWACLAGAFGRPVQLSAAIILVAAVGVVAWAFWPEPAAPPPRRRAAAGAVGRRVVPPSTATASAPADRTQNRRRSTGSKTAIAACGESTATSPVARSAGTEPMPPQSGTAGDAGVVGKPRRRKRATVKRDLSPDAVGGQEDTR